MLVKHKTSDSQVRVEDYEYGQNQLERAWNLPGQVESQGRSHKSRDRRQPWGREATYNQWITVNTFLHWRLLGPPAPVKLLVRQTNL